MSKKIEIRDVIASKGLKVTPQRMRVLEAVNKLKNHPTAENIIEFIRQNDPNIGVGTVYKILETLVESNIITKVKTDKDIVRYDGVMEQHHHLYSIDSDQIADYKNSNLDSLLQKFFQENQIENFTIEDIKVSINGNFTSH